MHLLMILGAVLAAILVRLKLAGGRETALVRLVVPPLLLASTATAVLWMLTRGVRAWDDYLAIVLSAGWLVWLAICGLRLGVELWRTHRDLVNYPLVEVAGAQARLLPGDQPFAACVGFWDAQLVVSRALLTAMTPEHLAAVIAHEQAHYHYRDTFVFFWLGWLRRILPWQTGSSWQDLVMLRELRADRWATHQADPLVLAEALVALAGGEVPIPVAVGLNPAFERLEERVEALISCPDLFEPEIAVEWWLLALVPFAAFFFHNVAAHGHCPTL